MQEQMLENYWLLSETAKQLAKNLSTKIFGLNDIITEVIVAVLCNGHALLTGAPGLAKTTLVKNLASSLGCGYKRIQFTPDLTPYDILGGEIIKFDEYNPDIKKLVFIKGPIFAPFILADEINRASPRTQSALLEAMQERQVTIAGVTYKLPEPFFVFATQNPIENEGTFPLPEAQLDRFLLNIELTYPNFEAELEIALLSNITEDLLPLNKAYILYESRKIIENFPLKKTLLEGIVRIVRNTRPEESSLSIVQDYVDYGASPRASQSLVIASKAYALLNGAKEVEPEHIMYIAKSVLRHRCLINFKAISEKHTVNTIVNEILNETVL